MSRISVHSRKPVSRSQRPPSDAFVGRARELASLVRLLDGAGVTGGSALVEGDAGIGKTTLVSELLDVARRRGVRVLQGCCYQMQEAGPYFPFVQILSQAQPGRAQLVDHIRGLAGDAPGGSDWIRLGEDARSRRAHFLKELTEAILGVAATEETVLCVEDIQWADVGSLLVLNSLMDIRRRGLLIICTARTEEPADAGVRQLVERVAQKSRRIALQGLSHSEVQEVVRNLGGPGWVTEEGARDLRSLTKGNPLFLRELFLHLRETGLLLRHSVQEAARRTRTPETLAHAIDLRLRSLPASVKGALAVASVVGAEFSASLVAYARNEPHVANKPDGAILDELEVGVARHILQPVDGLDATRYRFTHPLIASRLYDSLSVSQQRNMHRRVAEAGGSGNVVLSPTELARHHALGFGTAGGRRTIAYCRAAAEQAESVLAFEMAGRYWELALRCTRPRSRRTMAELHRRLGWALWAAGKWERAGEAWSRAVELFESLGARGKAGQICLALGDMYRWRLELDDSERWLDRALSLVLRTRAERGHALALLGSIQCIRDDHEAGLPLLEEAKRLVGGTGGDPLVKFWLSYGLLTSGDPTGALAVAKEGLDEAVRRKDSHATRLLGASLFHYELSRLSHDPARKYARMMEDGLDPTDAVALANSLSCQALLLGYQGKWNQAVRLCERWMSQVRLASPYHVASARLHCAEAKLALGDAEAAQSEMSRALPDLGQMRPLAAMHLARAKLLTGSITEADSLVHDNAEELIGNPRFATGRVVLGDVAARLEVPDLWQRCYDLLEGEERAMVMVYSPTSVQRVLGRLAARLKLPAAADHFDTALEQLTKGGARWELAQTYLDYAEMHRAWRRRGHARRGAALELQAYAIYDDLGIRHETLKRPSSQPRDDNRFALTGREMEVLDLVAEGRRNPEVAGMMGLSIRTIERHVENIFHKLRVNSRTEAVVLAVQQGLVGPVTRSSNGEALDPARRRAAS